MALATRLAERQTGGTSRVPDSVDTYAAQRRNVGGSVSSFSNLQALMKSRFDETKTGNSKLDHLAWRKLATYSMS